LNLVIVNNILRVFQRAKCRDIPSIYGVLVKAFAPYKQQYTPCAYAATVVSPADIEQRMVGKDYELYVVTIGERVVGTVSVVMKEQDRLHIRSMAVLPVVQQMGVGRFIMEKIEALATQNHVAVLSLDTSKPLERAIRFYQQCGFAFTGVTHDFYGVEIFEMMKKL
jgi:GNAT superfamily N-acetyltransferase